MPSTLFGALVALLLLSGNASNLAQQPEEHGWTSLSAGQSLNDIQYRQDLTVAIGDRAITKCSNSYITVDISAPSPQKRLAIIMCDEEDARNKAYVVALSSGRVLFPLGITNAVFDKWVAWSPDERFALLGSGGEGFQGPMVLVNLTSGLIKKIDFKRLGLKGETEVLDDEATSWLNGSSFRMKLNVVCQVFADNPRCASGPCKECDNGVHRAYWARVNLSPLTISYSTEEPRIPRAATTAGPANAPSEIRKVDFLNFTYDSDHCWDGIGSTVTVRNGNFQTADQDMQSYFGLIDNKIIYGDLTGDGREEAAVPVGCGLTCCTGSVTERIFVYAVTDGKPYLLARLPIEWRQDSDEQGLTRNAPIKIFRGVLSIDRFAGNARCCPKFIVATNYKWNGTELVEIGKSRRPYVLKSGSRRR